MRADTAPLLAAFELVGNAAPAAEPAPPPRPVVTLDQLDPASIPADERVGGLPKGVVAVLGSSRGRHAGGATCAAVSPDGTLVASGGTDNLIRLWDARTLRPVAVLKGHAEPPAHLAFSPDSKWLVSGTGLYATAGDAVVRVWRVDGAKSRLAAAGKPHGSRFKHLRFVRDGRELLTISTHGEVRSWDLTADPPAEKDLFRVDLGEGTPQWWSVNAAEFTPDGRLLFVTASGKVGNRLRSVAELWDVAAGKRWGPPLGLWPDLQSFPHRLLPDGRTLAFGLVARGEGDRVPLRYVPDGTLSPVGEVDSPRRVVLWDLAGAEPQQVGTLPWEQVPLMVATAGRRSVSIPWRQTDPGLAKIQVWTGEGDRATLAGALFLPFWGPGRFRPPIGEQCLSADGSMLAAIDGNRVRVWDLADGGPVERAPDREPAWVASAVAFGPDGRSVLAAGDGLARWKLGGGPPELVATGRRGGQWEPFRYTYSRDGRRVVWVAGSWTDPSPVRVLDTATGRATHTLPRLLPGDPANPFIAYSPAAALNAAGTVLVQSVFAARGDGTPGVGSVRVWDLRGETPRLTAQLRPPDSLAFAITVSPDGRRVAAEVVTLATDTPRIVEAAVRVWDAGRAEPTEIATLDARTGGNPAVLAALAITPDGTGVAVGGLGEDRLRVWDLAPKPRERWQAEVKGGVTALAFAPDGRLVGAGGDGLSVWDGAGKAVARWPELAGTPAFAVAPDGRHLAAAVPNGTVLILRLPADREPTGQEILDRIGKAYATCKTYRDRGTVVAEYTGPDKKKEGTDDTPRMFTTAFRRGGAFRFEFRNPNPLEGKEARNGFTKVVWAKGDEVKVWPGQDLPADTGKGPRVLFPLGVLAGVTEGVSHTVPRLLLLGPKDGGGILAGETAERLADERVAEADCYRVRLDYEMPNLEDGSKLRCADTYWIDRQSDLIWRVRKEMTLADNSRVVTTIDYHPAFDVDLEPAELEFRPPKKP